MNNYSLMIKNNGNEHYFYGKGVVDLFNLVNNKSDILPDAYVVDKAIGKAAAALMVIGKVKKVQTPLISIPGLNMLNENKISVEYDDLVPILFNIDKTGPCPLEIRCNNTDSLGEIFLIIKDFLSSVKTHG
jgi:hypothetical protein